MKPCVIFIDDDANVLRGLKRLFRVRRDAWDMSFLAGGEEAIAWLSENQADAIVCDMRMPHVDGADVLEYAAKHKNGRVRMVLSGEADRELTLRTIGTSHQFLSKPCDDGFLAETIDVALGASELGLSEDGQRIVSNVTVLPAPPQTHEALVDALDDANPASVAEVVSRDPALTMRVLQLANSAYFGRRSDSLSIATAVRKAGLDTLNALYQQKRLISWPHSDEQAEALAEIGHSAVETARKFYILSREFGIAENVSEDCFAIGLMSWIGDVVRCAEPEIGERIDDALAASAYLVCIYGFPQSTSRLLVELALEGTLQAMQSLQTELGDAQTLNAKTRASLLARLRYVNERAA